LKQNPKVRAGIAGGAGYTGGELLRILLNHPDTEIAFVQSKSQSGSPVYSVHSDLSGETELNFSSDLSEDIDVLFLCMGHGDSRKFLEQNAIPAHVRIIDLSQDFRLSPSESKDRKFVYGLPELDREAIRKADNIANPGCFATAIQIGLLPLAAKGIIKDDIHTSGITGSTGAGQSLSETSHFSWRNNNISAYKVFEHQHLNEIGQSLKALQRDYNTKIRFVPYRGNFSRGILITSYLKTDMNLEEAKALYRDFYKDHPFVHVQDTNPHLKQVMNTNKGIVYLEKHDDTLVIISIIDNLLKGASGQAVQNMNLMFGLEETAGLKLKAAAF
jgi:N-acetyl-gamma-glutamyl-phosphate reductase